MSPYSKEDVIHLAREGDAEWVRMQFADISAPLQNAAIPAGLDSSALLSRRTQQEKEIIRKAKKYLMRAYAMTEPEAHRALQKGAMDKSLKLSDFAARLLEAHPAANGRFPQNPGHF